MYNKALKDALYQTKSGKALIVQSKKSIHSQKIGDRIRKLKNLVYTTFVSDVPQGASKRFDVYNKAKPAIRKLGKKGGEDYNHAITALKYVWVGIDRNEQRKNYKDAIQLLESA
jgi:hypothetical protein